MLGFLLGSIVGLDRCGSRVLYPARARLAWIGQITMFVVLGLLSTPAELIDIAGPALLLAAVVLTLIARPVAVVPFLVPASSSARPDIPPR